MSRPRFFRIDKMNNKVILVGSPTDWVEVFMEPGLYTEEEMEAHNRYCQAQIPCKQREREELLRHGLAEVLNG